MRWSSVRSGWYKTGGCGRGRWFEAKSSSRVRERRCLAGNKVVAARNSLAATYGGIGRTGSTLVQAESKTRERESEVGKGKSRTRCSYQLRNDNCLPRLRDREARYQPSCRIMDSSRPSGFVSLSLVPSDSLCFVLPSPPPPAARNSYLFFPLCRHCVPSLTLWSLCSLQYTPQKRARPCLIMKRFRVSCRCSLGTGVGERGRERKRWERESDTEWENVAPGGREEYRHRERESTNWALAHTEYSEYST